MRVFLIGQKAFGAQVFDLCRRLGHDVTGVCAPAEAGTPGHPDRLRARAEAVGVSWRDVPGLRRDPLPESTDLIVCAHAHVYVPGPIRAQARWGAIGYHPSLLPRWRGKRAVEATIAAGDTVAGGTVYWLDDGYDAGPIAAQASCPVRFHEPGELWRRQLAPLGLLLLEEALRMIATGAPRRWPQDESRASDARTFLRGYPAG